MGNGDKARCVRSVPGSAGGGKRFPRECAVVTSIALQTHCVFVTGGTGYVGRPLINRLIERGHVVRALARPASATVLPSPSTQIIGDALDSSTYAGCVAPAAAMRCPNMLFVLETGTL